jgi:hypothetical protein
VTNTSTAQATTTVVGTTTSVQQATVTNTTTAEQTTTVGRTTTAPAPRVDQCPNVRGLQTKVPAGMVKRNGKCVSSLSLTASGLVRRPTSPVAGQQFAVGFRVANQKTKKGIPAAVVTCPASLTGKPLTARRTLFDRRNSAAYCYWMVPASARGGVLQVAVVATYQGAHVRRWLRATVK